MTEPFDPDWVIAPSETLRELITESVPMPTIEMSAAVMSTAYGGRNTGAHVYAEQKLLDVLARKPLTEEHIRVLAVCTHISGALWRNLEHNYRVGLAAGKKDLSDE